MDFMSCSFTFEDQPAKIDSIHTSNPKSKRRPDMKLKQHGNHQIKMAVNKRGREAQFHKIPGAGSRTVALGMRVPNI